MKSKTFQVSVDLVDSARTLTHFLLHQNLPKEADDHHFCVDLRFSLCPYHDVKRPASLQFTPIALILNTVVKSPRVLISFVLPNPTRMLKVFV